MSLTWGVTPFPLHADISFLYDVACLGRLRFLEPQLSISVPRREGEKKLSFCGSAELARLSKSILQGEEGREGGGGQSHRREDEE